MCTRLIVLLGGLFIIYTAIKEIDHMLAVEEIEHVNGGQTTLCRHGHHHDHHHESGVFL